LEDDAASGPDDDEEGCEGARVFSAIDVPTFFSIFDVAHDGPEFDGDGVVDVCAVDAPSGSPPMRMLALLSRLSAIFHSEIWRRTSDSLAWYLIMILARCLYRR
jgi:hypothetical protein